MLSPALLEHIQDACHPRHKDRGRETVFARILLGFLLLATAAPSAARSDDLRISHTRHRASLAILRHYTPIPYRKSVHEGRQEMLRDLFLLFVHEGGYLAEEAARVLGVEDIRVEETARVFRKLDRRRGFTPVGEEEFSQRPGALLLSLAVALTYSKPSTDGLYAAAHLARLGCDDDRTEAAAQACYALASFCLLGEETEKRTLLEKAAANTDDPYLARRIRGIQTTRWDRLPAESSIEGRLLRSLYLWYHQDTWSGTVRVGRERLRHPESQWFLAVFAAMWHDLSGLPEPLLERMNDNPADTELDLRLYRLAETGILIPVPDTILAPPEPRDHRVTTHASEPEPEPEAEPTAPAYTPPTPPSRPDRPAPPQIAAVRVQQPQPERPSAPVPPAPLPVGHDRPAPPTPPAAPSAPTPVPPVHVDLLTHPEPETTGVLAHPGTTPSRTSPQTRAATLPLVPAVAEEAMALPISHRLR